MQYYFFKCHAQYFATSFILVIYSEHAIAIPKLGTDGNQDDFSVPMNTYLKSFSHSSLMGGTKKNYRTQKTLISLLEISHDISL